MKFKSNISKSGITLVISLLFFVNSFAQEKNLRVGFWRGVLQLNDSTELPFNFEVKYDLGIYSIDFINAEERISTNEIVIQKDSVIIKMPVFDSEFKCKRTSDSTFAGSWINHARKTKNVIPFKAKPLKLEAIEAIEYRTWVNGKWEVTFSPNTKDSTKAIGVFEERLHFLTGTFLTETGDYRFLSGEDDPFKRTFYLSCFDGSHAFLFKGKVISRDKIEGQFYSGSHWHEPWVAVCNDKFQLRNPDSLTYLKPGFNKVDFSFKNTEGKIVSLNDEKYKNKVVIVQLTGTWCPNCMDETKFLAPFYEKYKSQGLEIVALAFERTDDFAKAVSNVNRTKAKFNANYDFLITMKTGADQASEALPMLNKVMAFPTTIYIDKKGVVRKIYTGFNGPATGDEYTKFVEQTTLFVEKMLKE